MQSISAHKKSKIKIVLPRPGNALALADMGWEVFPLHTVYRGRCLCDDAGCSRPGKHPRTRNGFRDASSDPPTVRELWENDPESNIGVRTGNGLFVVDVDGEIGEESLRKIEMKHGPLPKKFTVMTGRGRHFYFYADCGAIRNSVSKIGRGIDIRGDGGYVVGPFSHHATGKLYVPLRNGCTRPVVAPEWLINLVLNPDERKVETKLERKGGIASSAYGEAAMRDELFELAKTPNGQRNNALNRSAFKIGQLVGSSAISQDDAVAGLSRTAYRMGLQEDEANRTIWSGLLSGIAEPRMRLIRDQFAHKNESDDVTKELSSLGETDADNAARFARRFRMRIMCTPGKGFLSYDGQRWKPDSLLEHMKFAEETARLIAKEAPCLKVDSDRASRTRFSDQSRSKGALDRMCALGKSHLMVEDARLDSDPWVLNVLNGTIDLRSGNLKPHSSADLLSKQAPVAFDKDAKCPRFLGFIRQALRDDDSLIEYVQRTVGYSLTGITREQVFFLLQGPTKTGKSTFLNLIRDLIGDYGAHTPSDTLLSKQYDNSIPADIARLAGVRLATAIEVNWHRQIDEAKIKSMTGGDTMTARDLYKSFFQFTPQFKLWFAVNDFPKARGTDGAFWQRVRVIPFNVQISAEDRDLQLQDALKVEAPGILAWAVRGAVAWQAQGLGTCSAVEEASGHWKRAADHVQKFVNEEVIFDTSGLIQSVDLYGRYRQWCEQNGESPVGDRKLKTALETLDLTAKRTRTGTCWQGVKLRLN